MVEDVPPPASPPPQKSPSGATPRLTIHVMLPRNTALQITITATSLPEPGESEHDLEVQEKPREAVLETQEFIVRAESERMGEGVAFEQVEKVKRGDLVSEAILPAESKRRFSARFEKLAKALRSLRMPSMPAHLRPWATALTLLMVVMPAILAFRDRWLDDPYTSPGLNKWWCESAFLCRMALPAYFAWVFLALLLMGVLIFLQPQLPLPFQVVQEEKTSPVESARSPRLQRFSRLLLGSALILLVLVFLHALRTHQRPGAGFWLVVLGYGLAFLLRAVDFQRLFTFLRTHLDWLLSLLVAHVALIIFLASAYSFNGLSWVAVLLLILAAANLVRHRRRIPIVFWLVTLALLLQSWDLRGWWSTVIGDEYSFFMVARDIADQQTLGNILANLANGQGVYGTHPYLSSLFQAASLKIFGSHNFAWRFSSIYFSSLALVFYYPFFRGFLQRWQALLATFLLAASAYLMDFARIGYNNTQAFFCLALVLWSAQQVLRSKSRLAFVGLGFCLGLCFYVYPAALYALPLPFLLHLLMWRPLDRNFWKGWGLALLTVLLLIFPLLFQPDYWSAKVAGLFFNNKELTASLERLCFHIGSNLLYAFFSFLYIPEESHFVVASYLDPLSGVFFVIGVVWLVRLAWSEQRARFWGISYLLMLVIAGASHDRQFPASTRMFMLLPFFSLTVVLGITWCYDRLLSRFPQRVKLVLGFVLALAILGLNVFQAYPLSIERSGRYQQVEALYLRMVQQVTARPDSQSAKFVFVSDPDWGIDGIRLLQEVYELPPTQEPLFHVGVTSGEFPAEISQILVEEDTLVIMTQWIEPTWKPSLELSLRQLGKELCVVNTVHGDYRFDLWHADTWNSLCE